MSVKSRLVYKNSDNNQEVIGELSPQNRLITGINTFTLEAEARNFKRAIIEGETELASSIPVLDSEFGTDEPVIKVQVDEDNDGNWTDRMRVYPEGGGNTLDNGRFRHEDLWGFKKFYGEDKVQIGPITGTIVDVVDKTLPTGYTVQYPGDETPPNVYNFTANDARQQIWTDIQEDFNHFIEFTEETDGNNDVIVKLQPKGYGDVQFSLTRGQEAFAYESWEFNDTSQIVSEVRVVGTDADGNTVNITRTPSDFSDVDAAERERFKPIKVGYLGGTTSEAEEMAEEIAKRNLNPLPSENGAVTTEIRDATSSNLNQSVGILDESRGPGIDDVFTVVKQKDFLHEGTSYLSFEFESESTQQQRRKWREHDSERANIYPDQSTDVGNQDFEGETGAAPSDTAKIGDVDSDPSDTAKVGGVTGGGGAPEKSASTEGIGSVTRSEGVFGTLASFSVGPDDTAGGDVYFGIVCIMDDFTDLSSNWVDNSFYDIVVRNTTEGRDIPSTFVEHSVTFIGVDSDNDGDYEAVAPGVINGKIHIPENMGGNEYELRIRPNSFDTEFLGEVTAVIYGEHTHPDNIDTEDFDHPHGDNIDTEDFDHGQGSPSDTNAHGTTGSTDPKNVNTATEEKTDR